MMILLLSACVVWKWAMFPTFYRNILPSSSWLNPKTVSAIVMSHRESFNVIIIIIIIM
jgi:hypothetical protein